MLGSVDCFETLMSFNSEKRAIVDLCFKIITLLLAEIQGSQKPDVWDGVARDGFKAHKNLMFGMV